MTRLAGVAIVALVMAGGAASAAALAPFVDTSVDPMYYVDRYNDHPRDGFRAWFDTYYVAEHGTIYAAVGLPEPGSGGQPRQLQEEEEVYEPEQCHDDPLYFPRGDCDWLTLQTDMQYAAMIGLNTVRNQTGLTDTQWGYISTLEQMALFKIDHIRDTLLPYTSKEQCGYDDDVLYFIEKEYAARILKNSTQPQAINNDPKLTGVYCDDYDINFTEVGGTYTNTGRENVRLLFISNLLDSEGNVIMSQSIAPNYWKDYGELGPGESIDIHATFHHDSETRDSITYCTIEIMR